MTKHLPLLLIGVLIIGLLAALFVSQHLGQPTATPTPTEEMVPLVNTVPAIDRRVIGQSVQGRDIEYVAFGSGDTTLLFVGGIHGGYEWNSSLLAWEMIDHFTQNPELIPAHITVGIIPSLNPDGLATVTGTDGRFTEADVTTPDTRIADARFNANGVDLNRNFDCKWAPESTWRGEVVSAGSAPFSEPEAAALRDLVSTITPDAVVFWHSQANNVYASECESGVLEDTRTLMETYAIAGSYGQVESFDAYPITGDAEGWLASIGIPAVTVELESFRTTEWSRNLAGTLAVIASDHFAK